MALVGDAIVLLEGADAPCLCIEGVACKAALETVPITNACTAVPVPLDALERASNDAGGD